MLPINRSVIVPRSVCTGNSPLAIRFHHSADPNRPSVGSIPKLSVVRVAFCTWAMCFALSLSRYAIFMLRNPST